MEQVTKMSKIGRSALKKSGSQRYASNLIPSISTHDEAIRNMIYESMDEENIPQWLIINIQNKGKYRNVNIILPKGYATTKLQKLQTNEQIIIWTNTMQEKLKERGIITKTSKDNLDRYVLSFNINNNVIEGMIKLL